MGLADSHGRCCSNRGPLGAPQTPRLIHAPNQPRSTFPRKEECLRIAVCTQLPKPDSALLCACTRHCFPRFPLWAVCRQQEDLCSASTKHQTERTPETVSGRESRRPHRYPRRDAGPTPQCVEIMRPTQAYQTTGCTFLPDCCTHRRLAFVLPSPNPGLPY